jgi:sterol desaturase/sphingolipid hydroxylase (fatty acid hydroxylase superfamily)
MSAVRDAVLLLIAKLPSLFSRLISIGDVAGFTSVLLFAILLDRVRKQDTSRYARRAFRVDLTYAFFYLFGVYTVLVGLPLFRFLTRIFDSLFHGRALPLGTLPVAVQILIGLVAVDLFSYGWHRTVHTSRFLWPFHSIHHSQQYLTVSTGFRTHFVDEIVRTTFMFVPLYFLGIRPHTFLAVDLVVNWILGLQHSDLPWSYGAVGNWIVSPRYHRLHHSLDPIDRDKNFAVLFPFWDRLFGTRMNDTSRPLRYGVDGEEYPESFLRQLAWPFILVGRQLKVRQPFGIDLRPSHETDR